MSAVALVSETKLLKFSEGRKEGAGGVGQDAGRRGGKLSKGGSWTKGEREKNLEREKKGSEDGKKNKSKEGQGEAIKGEMMR